jgi:hypothetical protein
MSTDTNPSQTPPDAALVQLVFGKCISMAISVAAKLRIADFLADGPKTVADLATNTKTHAPSLYRILRTLAAVGVFAEQIDGRFAPTPMGEYLRTGVKGSLRGMADFYGSDWSWRAWGHLLESVQTGRPAFDSVFGEPVFDYLGKHPDESAVFNETRAPDQFADPDRRGRAGVKRLLFSTQVSARDTRPADHPWHRSASSSHPKTCEGV